MAARGILACAGVLLLGCSASAGSRVATANEDEARSALAAEGAAGTPAPSDDEGAADGGSFYEPDPRGSVSAVLRRDAPNMRYVRLGRDACEAELRKRGIAFERVGLAPGVLAPVRLRGPLRGVTFRSELPPAERAKSALEIFDCRLVLALDDFAKILSRHDIVEVVHLSVYRPASKKAKLKNGAGRRHGGALAIDAALFKTSDGRTLDVKKDFHGAIGARTCPPPASASELRRIACEASEARLFNVLLTPDYNWAHRNHFHLEVTANARWFFVR